MAHIGRFLPFPPDRRNGDAYTAFCSARREAAQAWLRWLRERPAPDDVAMELATTIAIFRQVAALAAAEPWR